MVERENERKNGNKDKMNLKRGGRKTKKEGRKKEEGKKSKEKLKSVTEGKTKNRR